jgi:hypothetical protein
MAATSWNALQPRLLPKSGSIPYVIEVPEAASQSFKAGTPLYLVSNKATICADSTDGFLGIAMEDASGTTDTSISVQVAAPDACFVVARVTNNGTDALASTCSIGQGYAWYADADSVFYADTNDTTNPVLIYEAPIKDNSGSAGYWGLFSIVAGLAGNIDEENSGP